MTMYHFFRDRTDASRMLLPYLLRYRNEDCIVLAVPRGGVPVAAPIARHFSFPLDLLMTKKIGHPAHPEFAIGAVSLDDHTVDEEHGIPKEYITTEVRRIRTALGERYNFFMGGQKAADPEGKTVIIIDDGMATGNTILSAVRMIRKRRPEKIVVAVPVASAQAIGKIKAEADDVICVYTPEPFIGVGLHYNEFAQVSDEEVVRQIRDANRMNSVA